MVTVPKLHQPKSVRVHVCCYCDFIAGINFYAIVFVALKTVLFSDFSLGKSVEHMRGAAVSIHINDPILRYSITLSRISSAFQFFCDNIYLFSKLGIVKLDQDNLVSISCKCWLYADLMNIIRVVYEIRHEINEQIDRQESNLNHSDHSFYSTCRCVMSRRPDLFVDLVKNVSDIWLPLHSSGYTTLSPGTVGFCGTVSSVLGAATIWQKSRKL